MKHFNKLFVSVLMIAGLSAVAQDSDNPWAISFGVNAVDTKPSASKRNANLKDHFSEVFNVNDHWNILPSVSYVSVFRNVGGNFSVGLTGSVNKINKWVNWVPGRSWNKTVVVDPNLMYYSGDLAIKYSLMNLIKSKVIDPSIHLGGGYTWLGEKSGGTANLGGSLTFWFTEQVGLTLTSNYKKAFDTFEERGNYEVTSVFQHSAGLIFKFGGKDKDDDGIYDKYDECPDVAGLKEFKGCPDTDKDGIEDKLDACPELAGPAELNGCPDTDGDGVADKDDSCPEVAGLTNLKGCPDADEDGVADNDDKCPTVKGPVGNEGCPWPDTDGDSVLDKDDKCPNERGTVANNGCPEKEEVQVDENTIKKLNDYAKTILFNTAKDTFQEQTYPILQSIVAILKEYPDSKFSIEGHTDSDGKDAANQKLSENRASAVKNYFIQNGINAARLSSQGFGESNPIAPNTTKAGKAQNRRVEVKVVK